MSSQKRRTLAVHAGSRLEESQAVSLVPPIYASAVSYFDDAEALDGALDGKDFSYGRIRAQNTVLLEEALAALEGTEACAVFSSGMAALRAVFDAQGFQPGEALVMASDGYGVTRSLMKALCGELGVTLHALPLSEPQALEAIHRVRPRLVIAESVTNPLLAVPDLRLLSQACQAVGARLAVDATFPSPALQRACEFGADYALQSTTKWLNGHSDALGGSVSGTKERIAPLLAARLYQGAILGPFEAWLTLRGVRTLHVRMKAHSEHAEAVARRLVQSPEIAGVRYPGLPEDPSHRVARELLVGGFGGMLAFEIKGAGRAQAFRFLEQVKVAKAAPSLGDVSTLVMHPATASARRMTPEEREVAGIHENLIRVSVGLEDPDDVADDLLQAVERAMG